MSKFLVALLVLAFACVALGRRCGDDNCSGKKSGKYRSDCGPCNRYYGCSGGKLSYGYCSGSHSCIQGGVCGACLDNCYHKRNGNYPSSDNPRPFYYSCYNGHLNIEMCHPNEVFNAWTRKCECYELFCEMGDGYQPSVCDNGGCSGYVKCRHGFAVIRKRCGGSTPYFCCEKRRCQRHRNPHCGCH